MPKKKLNLPKPECELGYPEGQIQEIMGDRYKEFCRWMYGQTMAICENKLYSYARKEYYEGSCGVAHGSITYYGDVLTFLEDRPILD